MEYYQKNNDTDQIIQVTKEVLKALMQANQYDNNSQEIEIQIRHFLKNTYIHIKDYNGMIANLERLFLVTGSLTDYKELIKMYKNQLEKEKFWQVIKKHFDDEYQIHNIFKVFKFEDQKQEILLLVEQYPEAKCFAEMITFICKDYPQKCFSVYKNKIEKILIEPKIERYFEATFHLKNMGGISLDKEFIDFINWIKTTYWRRRRLIEELQENKL